MLDVAGSVESARQPGYSAVVARVGTILLVLGYAAGVVLAVGGISASHPAAARALFYFAIATCPIGAALVTAAFARMSMRHYKARAERRKTNDSAVH